MRRHRKVFICRSIQNAYTWEGWCSFFHFEVVGVGKFFLLAKNSITRGRYVP